MKCRINHLTKPLGYAPFGIRAIRLLDYDDFVALQFDPQSGGLYNNNRITAIFAENEWIDLETTATAKYSLAQQNGQYVHTVETFLNTFTESVLSNLDLAAKRRKYVVLFGTTDNRYFLFGSDAGAQLTYSLQTDEAIGSAIKLSVVTPYPLFEVTANAAASADNSPIVLYMPNDVDYTCELVNGETNGTVQYSYMMKVSAKSGEALDANGNFCSLSGNPQAYRKLNGAENLIGNFQVESIYSAHAEINGTPTYTFSPTLCPICMNAEWLLLSGIWNDNGRWVDAALWKD